MLAKRKSPLRGSLFEKGGLWQHYSPLAGHRFGPYPYGTDKRHSLVAKPIIHATWQA